MNFIDNQEQSIQINQQLLLSTKKIIININAMMRIFGFVNMTVEQQIQSFLPIYLGGCKNIVDHLFLVKLMNVCYSYVFGFQSGSLSTARTIYQELCLCLFQILLSQFRFFPVGAESRAQTLLYELNCHVYTSFLIFYINTFSRVVSDVAYLRT